MNRCTYIYIYVHVNIVRSIIFIFCYFNYFIFYNKKEIIKYHTINKSHRKKEYIKSRYNWVLDYYRFIYISEGVIEFFHFTFEAWSWRVILQECSKIMKLCQRIIITIKCLKYKSYQLIDVNIFKLNFI